MTEQEAKTTKWCPQMLPFKSRDPEANWGWDGKCLGSACMAWRCDKEATAKRMKELMPGSSVEINGHFYCGLAGKP